MKVKPRVCVPSPRLQAHFPSAWSTRIARLYRHKIPWLFHAARRRRINARQHSRCSRFCYTTLLPTQYLALSRYSNISDKDGCILFCETWGRPLLSDVDGAMTTFLVPLLLARSIMAIMPLMASPHQQWIAFLHGR